MVLYCSCAKLTEQTLKHRPGECSFPLPLSQLKSLLVVCGVIPLSHPLSNLGGALPYKLIIPSLREPSLSMYSLKTSFPVPSMRQAGALQVLSKTVYLQRNFFFRPVGWYGYETTLPNCRQWFRTWWKRQTLERTPCSRHYCYRDINAWTSFFIFYQKSVWCQAT